MRILLDTSVIIDVLRYQRARHDWLRQRAREGDSFASCAITVAEIYAGMRPSEAQETNEFLEQLEYVQISEQAARRAGTLKYEWQRRGRTLSLPDAIMAAVAITEDLDLATDNSKDYPMPEVRLVQMP
jgi:predicted nucleic acid-binding protein